MAKALIRRVRQKRGRAVGPERGGAAPLLQALGAGRTGAGPGAKPRDRPPCARRRGKKKKPLCEADHHH